MQKEDYTTIILNTEGKIFCIKIVDNHGFFSLLYGFYEFTFIWSKLLTCQYGDIFFLFLFFI